MTDLTARVWAITAAVAEHRITDVTRLLTDLDNHDQALIVTGLAEFAVLAIADGRDTNDPKVRARIGEQLRRQILATVEKGRPGDTP